MSRHMASFAPLLSIGRLATIRRKPRVPIADDRERCRGYVREPEHPHPGRSYLYDCTNKMDLSTKKPRRRPSQFVARPLAQQSRKWPAAWMENFVFLLQNSDTGEASVHRKSVASYLSRISLFYL